VIYRDRPIDHCYNNNLPRIGQNIIFNTILMNFILTVILHQLWVKKLFPWKFNLEYGDTFTKLFMHVSSRNMFPTIRNLQIRVHVYRPRQCCRDWLSTHTFLTMIIEESVCFISCEPFFFWCNDSYVVHTVGNIFRLETCMNSLVKVSPYSKLDFQGKISSPKTGVILL
jgi:hypothetical protein